MTIVLLSLPDILVRMGTLMHILDVRYCKCIFPYLAYVVQSQSVFELQLPCFIIKFLYMDKYPDVVIPGIKKSMISPVHCLNSRFSTT